MLDEQGLLQATSRCHCKGACACPQIRRATIRTTGIRPASLTCQSMVSCKTD